MNRSPSTEWTKISDLGAGGTAVSLAHSTELDGKIWVGSPAGLFTLDTQTDTLTHIVHDVPFASVHAVVLAGDTLLAAGLPANLIYSSDGGKHWLRATLEGAGRPFTSLAPSPNILHDGVVLAGTAGQGIMRSTDGGRYWEFATFGLDDYNVLVIACSPVWTPEQNGQEVAITGTANGIFQSPNGGRAWRKCQVAEHAKNAIAQSICFSPDFSNSQTVFAGTEAHGLLVSADAGLTWQRHTGFPADRSVTALLIRKDELIAATGRGEIYRSDDLGKTWRLAHTLTYPITCLATAGNSLVAGLVNGGLQTIQASKTQSISGGLRRFDQLVAHASADKHSLQVNEIGVGRWLSIDQGMTWNQDVQADKQITIDPPLDNLLTATADGAVTIGADRKTIDVWVQTASGAAWQKAGSHIAYGRTPRLAVLETGSRPAVALTLGPNCLILRRGKWQSHKIGSEGSPLTAIIRRPNETVACATFDHLHLFDGQSWNSHPAPAGKRLTSLALSADDKILALTTDGLIYQF